jgi:hypothetical protein
LTSFINATNESLDRIRDKYPGYDFTLASRMTDYIADTLMLNNKHDYVANHVIDFLIKVYKERGDTFEPCMASMFHECYLNDLIKDAHKNHYMAVCNHKINFIESCDDDYFINSDIMLNDSIDDSLDHYATIVSVNIIKFENDDGFNLNSRKCSCREHAKVLFY